MEGDRSGELRPQRFSLRAMMIATALLCVCLASLTVIRRTAALVIVWVATPAVVILRNRSLSIYQLHCFCRRLDRVPGMLLRLVLGIVQHGPFGIRHAHVRGGDRVGFPGWLGCIQRGSAVYQHQGVWLPEPTSPDLTPGCGTENLWEAIIIDERRRHRTVLGTPSANGF